MVRARAQFRGKIRFSSPKVAFTTSSCIFAAALTHARSGRLCLELNAQAGRQWLVRSIPIRLRSQQKSASIRASVTIGRREHPRATIADRLGLNQSYGFGTYWPKLGATFSIFEADCTFKTARSMPRGARQSMSSARPSTHSRRSARASMRRNPVTKSRRIAARAVAFSPTVSASRIVCPS